MNSNPTELVEIDIQNGNSNTIRVNMDYENLFLQGYNDKIQTGNNGNSTFRVSSGLLNKILN